MKKIVGVLFVSFLFVFFAACGSDSDEEEQGNQSADTSDSQEESPDPADTDSASETPDASDSAEEQDETDTNDAKEGGKILVAYFSRTENTKPLAEYAADILAADLFRIEAADPYTDADIDYNTDCRAKHEQQDEASRPAIKADVTAMDQYDVVVIAHPVWYGIAPRIVSTFLESYDFSGKKLVTFCTSAATLECGAENLHQFAPNAVWLESRRFAIGTPKSDVEEWLKEIGLDM